MVLILLALQESRGVSDAGELQRLTAEGVEAADFISSFVVQARLNDRGNYGVVLCPSHVQG